MKPIKNFNKVQPYSNGPTQLPPGGYVLKITGVRYEDGQNGFSDRIVVAFDVLEGEYAGFFKKKFDADMSEDKKWKGSTILYIPKEDGSKEDEWTTKKFKTFTNALEDSNKNYHWDWEEKKWKNLLIGGAFGEVHTLIDGKQIQYTTFKSAYSVDDIRNNNFRIPKPQYKNGTHVTNMPPTNSTFSSDGFISTDDIDDEGVPF